MCRAGSIPMVGVRDVGTKLLSDQPDPADREPSSERRCSCAGVNSVGGYEKAVLGIWSRTGREEYRRACP